MRPRPRVAFLVFPPLALLAGSPAPAVAQTNDYETRYGQTVEVSVDNLLQMPESYVDKAVRTRGRLDLVPTSSTRLTYGIRGTFGGYLYLFPMPEVEMDFETEMRRSGGKEVEVTGAVGMGSDSGQRIVYIQVWGFLGAPDEKARRKEAPEVTLEELVTRPQHFEGKTVTVRGQFRGGNLFGDLPSASRQRSSDWVLKEDLFAAWVSGKNAKGQGWTLDPNLRRDTGKWLQVTGRVLVIRQVVTIQATDVVLSKPRAEDALSHAEAQKPPPPPPKPKKPPVVVFALPLDGERDVPPDSRFKIQFSKDMDEESFKGRVVFRYAGRPQPGDNALDAVHVSYDGGLKTLQVDPGDLLRPGRVVEVLLLPGIVDLDGLPLETRPGKSPSAATDVLRFQVAGGGLLSGP
ncbi:MAG TPA: Ig-like domain-containing protein [Vicinamibacteria bacterium]|nr:Ig-like domain-containing protein [Vicinamibacteria bacterium]